MNPPRPAHGRRVSVAASRAALLAVAWFAAAVPLARAADVAAGAELRAAPTHVMLDGRRLTLAASLRRDGTHLTCVLAVSAGDGKPLPSGARVSRAWLVYGDTIWEAGALDEQDAADPAHRDARGVVRNRPESPELRVVVRNAPGWEAGARVDAVVRVSDAKGRSLLLRVPRQVVPAPG